MLYELSQVNTAEYFDKAIPNMERINEAKEYIKKCITERIYSFRDFTAGFSGGKDSCVLVQLILEALDEMDPKYKERFYVNICKTRYELNRQQEHMERQIKLLRAAGINVEVGQTILEESFGLVTLGCGVISLNRTKRLCNKMKETVWTRFGKRFPFSFTGVRSEESNRRALQPREKLYGNLLTCAPLKHLTVEDVWGYLRQIGTTKWGMTYEELRDLYSDLRNGRDGCWVCCFHKGTEGYTPAQKVVIEKLDKIRGYGIKKRHYAPGEVATALDYPGRTVPWPTARPLPLLEMYLSQKPTAGMLRPVNVCRAAYKIVCDIEKEYGEEDKIIFEDEKHLIPDLQMMRERYQIFTLRRWMLNPATWCGRRLLDLDPLTEATYSKYLPPAYVARRTQGDWFGRHAREVERRPLYYKWAKKYLIDDPDVLTGNTEFRIDIKQKMLDSGYLDNESNAPYEDFYADGDPCSVGQENLQLEQIAANWFKN